jgi:putative FmdB family regulatory protein
MPLYEYKCQQTGNIYEVRQSIKDEPLTNCTLEGCPCGGKSPVERVISKDVGVIFHGTGFYETDYKHKGEHHSTPPPACDCPHSDTCPHSHSAAS